MDKQIIFNELIEYMRARNCMTDKVQKAYLFADKAHAGQTRKGGDEYIVHPLEVALTLTKLDLQPDVICAALLHDTIEDCGVSKEELAEQFGQNVADIVDSVSEIDKRQFEVNENNLFEDDRFVKLSRDEQTFQKLIGLGKKNIYGFYIKLADRLHNLRTIAPFEDYKKKEKVAQTQRWILPIAKLLRANYFYRALTNDCFKIINEGETFFFQTLNDYRELIRPCIIEDIQQLNKMFRDRVDATVLWHYIYSYELWNDIKEKIGLRQMSNISQGKFNKVATFEIKCLTKNETQKQRAVQLFLEKMNSNSHKSISLISASIEKLSGSAYYVLTDDRRNIFNLYIMTEKEYYTDRLGSLEGTNLEYIDDDNTHDIDTNYIKVTTKSGQIVYMPEDSTVLDFAFKLHSELGFSFDYAKINNSPGKYPAHTIIHEGDHIQICNAHDKVGNLLPVAQIKWLAYVNTAYAKKALIKYFEHAMDKMQEK